MPTSDKPSTVGLRGNIAAEQYNALRVRMRVDSGDMCAFNWASDLVPRFDNRRSVFGYLIADNEFHTYTVSLEPPKAETWAGQIRQVIFMPSNKPTNVEIASMELIWRPPEGPTRITLNNQTHEALFGIQH
ncbi:MAG: hypothetical protein KAJ01_05830, partial [Candidatus Hydrogenedentes bacterium]|nr:hypothetical protein [Candidatus Hydrogenedentota bacterium]